MNGFTGVLTAFGIGFGIWLGWAIRRGRLELDQIVTQALAEEAERLEQEADFQRWEASL